MFPTELKNIIQNWVQIISLCSQGLHYYYYYYYSLFEKVRIGISISDTTAYITRQLCLSIEKRKLHP